MKHLATIEKLKTDPFCAITVVDKDKLKNVVCNASAMKLEKDYGSVENLFETMFKNGVKSVRIFERRKSGTTFVPMGEPYDFDMVSNTETSNESLQPAVEAAPRPMPALGTPSMGLNGAGLTGAQIYQAHDYDRLARAHDKFELENAALKKEVAKLEKEALENQFSEKKATSMQEMLLGTLPFVMPLIGHKMGVPAGAAIHSPVGGLAGAEASPIKMHAATMINSLDDDTVLDLTYILGNLQNEALAGDLIALIEKYQLEPQA